MFSWMLQNSPKTFKTSNIFWSVRQVLAFPVEIHEFSCNSQNDWSELYMCSRNFSKYLELSESLWNTMIIFFFFCLLLDVFQNPHTFLNICWPFQHVPDLLKTLETYCIWYWFFNVSRKLPKFLGGLHILSRNLIKILAFFGFSPSFGNLFITCHFN